MALLRPVRDPVEPGPGFAPPRCPWSHGSPWCCGNSRPVQEQLCARGLRQNARVCKGPLEHGEASRRTRGGRWSRRRTRAQNTPGPCERPSERVRWPHESGIHGRKEELALPGLAPWPARLSAQTGWRRCLNVATGGRGERAGVLGSGPEPRPVRTAPLESALLLS